MLYVTTTFPTLAAFIENEVRRLHQRGIRVRVVTLRAVGDEFQPEHAELLQLTSAVGSPLSGLGVLLAWLARRPHVLLPALARMLWASRHSPYAFAGHLGYLPAAARVASLIEREDFERVHGAWAHFPASVAWLAARLTGARFSMAAHAGADLYRTQAFLAEKVRAADFTSCCVRGNAEMLRRLAPDAAGRVHWIYHGVDLARFGAAARSRSAEPGFLVVGRLSRAKGFDDAVRALVRLRARGLMPALVVVGEGPERATLEAIAREGGVESQVRFAGSLTHDGILPLYGAAWALLAPSKVLENGRRDGIPNVVIEAMAMGVPCIGTRAVGLEEAIHQDETGLLAAAGDPEGLAEAMSKLLADPTLVDRLGAGARRSVLASFDADANFERLLACFEGRA